MARAAVSVSYICVCVTFVCVAPNHLVQVCCLESPGGYFVDGDVPRPVDEQPEKREGWAGW